MAVSWTCRLLAVVALASTAAAQLELPSRPVPAKEQPASGPIELPGQRGDLADKVTGKGGQSDKEDVLVLPPAKAPGPVAPAAPGTPGAPGPGAPPAARDGAPQAAAAPAGASAFILGELAKSREVSSRLVDQAAEGLISLGEEGRGAARLALASDHGPTILAGAKVLLASGSESDVQLVLTRLKGKSPPVVGPAMVDALVAIDPVRGGPRLLAELLGHPQGSVRAAAYKHLSRTLSPASLPYLSLALGCDQSDGRFKAVELVANLPGPDASRLLLERLKDRSPQVASRAVRALAVREDPDLDAELLGKAFRLQWILRENAYALLAIVEREDQRLRPILMRDHVDALLTGLESHDMFVSGACAAALAGIGFRSEDGPATAWLDQQVPLVLLRALAGSEFHNDATSLFSPARARLALIANRDFGSDGPRWIRWWNENGKSFRAARAVIAVRPEEIGAIELAYNATTGKAGAFTLLGPEARAQGGGEPVLGDALRLSVSQVRELFDLCAREGLLGSERLPGVRGAADAPGRSLEVRVGERRKSFRFAGDSTEVWFERACAAAIALAEQNLWQRYPDATVADWLQIEQAWWDGEHDARERALRLKTCVLRWTEAQPPGERAMGVEELQRLCAEPGVAEAADFAPLLALLQKEPAWGPRAQALLGLCEKSARSLSGAEPAILDPTLAHDLAVALGRAFGPSSARDIERILAEAGPEAVRAAARAEEPFLRAVAANQLARDPDDQDVALLVELLDDPLEGVRVAAIAALGRNEVESSLPRIRGLAAASEPKVRAAALEALGWLGGPGVLELLVTGLEDPDSGAQIAAARGLAELGDPNALPVLVALISRGRQSAFFEPAREGLLKLGESAWPELLRIARQAGHPARREAGLLLSMQEVALAAPLLMAILTESQGDNLVAAELAVLTCVDLRQELNPAAAWWTWWDEVVHDDPRAWLFAAMEKRSVRAPGAEAFAPQVTREGIEFLLAVAAQPEDWLVERGRRELARLLGKDVGALPAPGVEREAWLAALRDKLFTRYP